MRALRLRFAVVLPFHGVVGVVLGLGLACNSVAPERPEPSPTPVATATTSIGAEVQAVGPVVPLVTTPASELQPPGYVHSEVLRIARDFGEDDFEIVLDAWVPEDDPRTIHEVRLWWIKLDKADERGPFSEKTKRHFEIAYERKSAGRWNVHMVSDDKRFTFLVEIGPEGRPIAHGQIVESGGRRASCRVTRGRIEARRVFGAPVGIKRVEVDCIDADGTPMQARLAHGDGDD